MLAAPDTTTKLVKMTGRLPGSVVEKPGFDFVLHSHARLGLIAVPDMHQHEGAFDKAEKINSIAKLSIC
jgi:hypothetical protein